MKSSVIFLTPLIILCFGHCGLANYLHSMLSGIGPAAQLTEHGIPIVHDSPYVGRNLHDHFAVYFAFQLRDPAQGYALGSAAWGQHPALSKGLPWDWVVSQPLPVELLAKHNGLTSQEQTKRNHCKYHNSPVGMASLLFPLSICVW